jgi:hypothetical protein
MVIEVKVIISLSPSSTFIFFFIIIIVVRQQQQQPSSKELQIVCCKRKSLPFNLHKFLFRSCGGRRSTATAHSLTLQSSMNTHTHMHACETTIFEIEVEEIERVRERGFISRERVLFNNDY